MSIPSQNHWNNWPCNARHADRAKCVDDAQYFALVRNKKFTAEPHLLEFMDVYNVRGKHILDVGCGIGCQAIKFARHGAAVTATDFSEVACRSTQSHAEAAGVDEQVVVARLDYDDSNCPDYLYDIIWAWGTLHHMENPQGILFGLRNYCAKPSTVLKVMVYHKRSTKVWRLMATHGHNWRKYTEAAEGVPISDAYTVKEARTMLEDAGWSVTSCQVKHIFRWSVPEYRQGQWVEAWPWSWVPERLFRWLEKRVGFHILLEGRPK